jgi:transglutaminase-like putative cysteine protease
MRRMADSVRDCLSRSSRVVRVANNVVAGCAPRDIGCQIESLSAWLDAHFRYLSDPVGVELLRDPNGGITEIVQNGFTQGDCDEAAMLAATLGMANGIPARFRALAFYTKDAPYSHVVCDLKGPNGWTPVDITKPANMEVPPTPTRTLFQVV